MASLSVEQRLLGRVARDPETGCLRWTGAHTQKGYGQLNVDDRRMAVHRLAYEIWVGPIPSGLEVDHVTTRGCIYRDCVEPTHLEAVTHAENIARQLAQKTVCRHGHPWVPSNLYTRTSHQGYEIHRCITCCHEDKRARKRKKNADG